jgi:hypothetical protein
MVQNMKNPSTGEHIIIGGLFLQVIFFGFFLATAAVFQLRIAKYPTRNSIELAYVWRKHMNTLYITSVLILVRSIVRVVEYLEGYDGYLMKHEVFIYIFDAFLMFLVMAFFHMTYPSEINCLLGKSEKHIRSVFKVEKLIRNSDQEMLA